MGYNFKGIDYRATCTATSFGTLCRNKEVAHNTTYKSVNLSKMKLQNIFVDVPDTSTKTNTITFPDELTFGISTIFVQLSTFTSTLTFTADKAKNIGVYGTVSSPLRIG